MHNAVFVVINRLIVPVSSLVLLIMIGRWSTALLGSYALVTAFYFVMQTLPLLGLTPFVMREVVHAPDRAPAYLKTIGAIAVVACLPINLGVHVALVWLAYPADVQEAIGLVGLLIVPGILGFLGELILISLDCPRPVALVACLENAGRVAASAVVLWLGGDVVGLIWVLFAGRIFSFLAYGGVLVSVLHPYPIRPLIDRAILRQTMRVLPAFVTSGAIYVLVSRLPLIVLADYATIEQIGYYGIAYRGYEIATLLSSAILTAAYPDLARHVIEPGLVLLRYLRGRVAAILYSVVPTAALGFAYAPVYVAVLFPKQYPFPVPLTRVFFLLLVIGVLDQFLSLTLSCGGRQKEDAKSLVIASVVAVASLLVLVPRFGAYGACASVLLTISTQFGLRLAWFTRAFGAPLAIDTALRFGGLSLCIVGAVILSGLASPVAPLLLAPLLCLVVYPVGLVRLGLLDLRPFRLPAWRDVPRPVLEVAAALSSALNRLRSGPRE